jgi:hypothetical protein
MRLSEYEKRVSREIEDWKSDGVSLFQQLFHTVMKPVDWLVEQVVPANLIDQASDAVGSFLSLLNDASEWTYDDSDLIEAANERGLEIESLNELQDKDLSKLDDLARSTFSENTLLAALEGGGTGLGGAALIAADIPMLFTINFRLIQQIGGAYGFSLRGPEYRPLVLSIFNVASSGSEQAKADALREMSVAAAAFAHGMEYRGRRVSGTFSDQQRHLPREIGKNIIGHKLGQMIPIAGAAIGAGINYWFTTQTAESSYMLFRALYIERKERL